MKKTYAALLAPEFRLQATSRHLPQLAGQPMALLEIDGTKSRVAELNNLAGASLVQRGMTPTQARARCPQLALLHPNAGHERSAQNVLLQAAEQLSPFMESTAPGVVTVDLPSERTFTETDFIREIVTPLQSAGLELHVGVARTPDLALLAARCADPVNIVTAEKVFLAPLPTGMLEPSQEVAFVLQSWGIRTIGQFVALPAAQVWERLGPESVKLWERANGGSPRPLQLVPAPEFFSEEADLDHPVEMLEPLLFLLRRFLEQISARLATVYLVAGKLRLTLRFDQGAPYERIFVIPQPTRDVTLLFRMLHTHLENFTSESPIVAVELAAKPVRPHTEQFDLLDRSLRDPHQFAETLARVEALLGSERVGMPQLESSHHPEAYHLKPCAWEAPVTSPDEELAIGIPWLRFRPREQAQIILNEKRPAFLYSSRSTGAIIESRGPWRIEGHWWESRRWAREEWDIATDDGHYRLVHADNDWFLDGIYT